MATTPTPPNASQGNGTPAATPVTKPVAVAPAKAVAKVQPPPFRLSSLQSRQRYWKMLFFGKHGIGKTELMGSAVDVPGMQDLFIVSAEKGEMTLEDTPRIKQKDKIFTAIANNIGEVSAMKDWLVAHCKYRDESNEAGLKKLEQMVGMDSGDGPARKFYSVGIDTLSEIQAFATYQAKGYGNEIAIDATLSKTEWDHFNQILDRMQILMRAYRDLPMHVFFLAQESYVQDESKKMIYSPALQGQMARKVQGFVDIVGYLDMGELVVGNSTKKVRRLWLQPQPGSRFAAKSRKSSFKEDFLDDPTLSSMMAAFGS